GRLFFNNNSVYLMAHSMQPQWLQRNAHLGNAYGGGMRTDHDQTTWPGRVNPGVNRAYRKGTLRDDGTLRHFTAACGPVIYRVDQFPSAILGDAFICEPGGNFIRRAIITDADGVLKSKNAYENTEFLTSTDE